MDNQSPKRSTGFLNLQAKLAIGFALLAIVSAGVITGAIMISVRVRIFQDLRDHLRDAVSIGALHVDGDAHALLTEPSQQDSSTYFALKQQFQQIRDAGTNFRFVYSLRNIDGVVQFIVDAEEDPELVSYLGDIYTDLPQAVIDLIPVMTEPYVNEEFYTDEWGVWLTGYAPIHRSDGTVDAVLAIDISVENVIAYQNSMLWATLRIFLLTVPVVGVVGWILGRQLARPILTLIASARRMETGDLSVRAEVSSRDETELLANAFNSMAAELGELVGGLEQRVSERTREVEQRSKYLKAAADVGRDAATILEPDELITRVVDLIREQFDLYYVGLFLVDEAHEWAVLRAGTGEAGKTMVERGHKIRIGEGMIGWCIEHAQARVALEAERDAVRLVTALLPSTRSEAALPLRSRGRVFGALTVQSDRPGVFDEATISVLQTMADQVSVALDNARLFSESEQAVKALRRSVSEYRRQSWQDTFLARNVIGYRGDARGLKPIVSQDEGNGGGDVQSAQSEDASVHRMQIPISIRGQVIGTIEASKSHAAGEWTQDEINLMSVLIDQLGISMENAQHYEDSLRRAERERVLAEITGHVRSTTDINEILRVAVQDLSEALRVPRGAIRLIRADMASPEQPPSPQPEQSGLTEGGLSHG